MERSKEKTIKSLLEIRKTSNSRKYINVDFFDVDRTLVKGSTGLLGTYHLFKKGIVKFRYLILGPLYANLHSFNLVTGERIYHIAFRVLKGIHNEIIRKESFECFEKMIRKRIYKKGVKLVQKHLAKGDIVVLLTA